MTINKIITGGQHNDPTEWDDNNPECKLCDKEAEIDDEYCEDHQRCCDCSDREGCNCKEELYCRCRRYKEEGYEMCYICLND
mgnify:CR=1 FL=1